MNQTKIEDAATLIEVLREMGMSYQETVSLLSKSLNEANGAKKLLRGESKGPVSPLIKLGITVFLVPVPVISESLGIILMSAGVFQSKSNTAFNLMLMLWRTANPAPVSGLPAPERENQSVILFSQTEKRLPTN